MNIFRKAVFKNLRKTASKRFELSDEWGDHKHRDKIQDGVTFSLKYLGSTLVEELEEEGTSYGDKISAVAVNTIVTMAKASKKKLRKVSLRVSPGGIIVMDSEDQSVMTDLDIYRICFCTADREHGRVFAFIARNKENETMECRAFLCRKRKMARGVTLAVAESFRIAKEICEMEEERMKMTRQPEGSRMVKLLEDLSPADLRDASNVVVKGRAIIAAAADEHHYKTSLEDFFPEDLPSRCSVKVIDPKNEDQTLNWPSGVFVRSPLQTSWEENLISF